MRLDIPSLYDHDRIAEFVDQSFNAWNAGLGHQGTGARWRKRGLLRRATTSGRKYLLRGCTTSARRGLLPAFETAT